MRTIVLLLMVLVLGGCTGTQLTRTSVPMDLAKPQDGCFFGGYPFQAVVVDYRIEADSSGEGNSYVILGSLAIDLVVDLVLSPIDLVAWAFGCEKRGLR